MQNITLNETRGCTKIIACDIDDTLLRTDNTQISIIKIKNGKQTKLSTDEFAKDSDKHFDDAVFLRDTIPEDPDPNKIYFSYKEFQDPDLIEKSIFNGTPLIKNLHIMDYYINQGYDMCLLTARSRENIIKRLMNIFLKYRDKDGNLKKLGKHFSSKDSFAVNDAKYQNIYGRLRDPDKKAAVLQLLCNKYESVVFLDDDESNIKTAEQLNLPNLKIIKSY